ncbi:HET-domain-containing protein [Pyrenochaeta sp. DS3sAY3a]|nr:HET-domain-containing protein [Pyrenochaeta sp. DS3sAY3a]
MEDYQYSPLLPGELTRVLALQPAKSHSDELHCQLFHISSGFPYIAISYAWGSQNEWSDLIMEDRNGHQDRPPSVLKITTTVELLLRRMRGSSAVRYFWIDALCINQADTVEKTQQVSRMFDIYRNASRVFAWLGDRSDGSEDFLKLIKDIEIEGDGVLREHFDRYGREFLDHFLELEWFQRRWVIQEVAAAREAVLVHGQTHMNFDTFAQILKKSTKLRNAFATSALGHIEAISRVRNSGTSSHHLCFATLLQVFHAAECSDDRDRIYSLLGLDSLTAAQGMGMIMVPDYSLSTTECYESFAINLAGRSTRDLFGVMQCAGAFAQEYSASDCGSPGSELEARAPTWIPDWTFPRAYRPLLCNENSLRAGHTPSAPSISHEIIIARHDMRLDGLILGNITHLSTDSWWDEDIPEERIIQFVLHWWLVLLKSSLADTPKYAGNYKLLIGDFARTITAGQIDLQCEPVFVYQPGITDGQRNTSKESSFEAFNKLLMEWLTRAKLLGENGSLVTMATDDSLDIELQHLFIVNTCRWDENIPAEVYPEVRRVHQIMEGRALFVTDSGHMGTCSMWGATGDIVGIPFGASTPFAFKSLSKIEPGQVEQHVRLVSDCYVEGVMEGQACQKSGIMRRTFVLS